MDLTKQKITLTDTEIKDAIKEYIHRHSSVECTSAINFTSNGNSYVVSASCEVEPRILNVLVDQEKTTEYGLRHTKSQFMVNSIIYKNEKIVLGIGNEGLKWKSIKAIFASFRDLLTKVEKGHFVPYSGQSGNLKEKVAQAKDQLKEDLLEFEIVEFGEIKKQEMTFHLDELAKV